MRFFGVTALTAFNRIAETVNCCPFCVGIKELTAFCLKVSGVSGVYATIPEK